MTIFIAADHRGLELKNKIIDYLHEKNIRVEDLGAYEYNIEDDYPDFAQKVTQAVLQNPNDFLGIIICGSGVGMTIAANRHQGIRCGLGFNEQQVKHARENDHINVLSLASDFTNFEAAVKLTEIFIFSKPKEDEKYLRRIKKLDSF